MAQEVAIEAEQAEDSGVIAPRILRGRLDSFALYEITDDELSILEMGSPGSLYLNFSTSCLSIAISFFVALLTATVSNRVFTVFVVLTTVGFVSGTFLFILWLRSWRSITHIARRIRARIPVAAFSSRGEQGEAQQRDLTTP